MATTTETLPAAAPAAPPVIPMGAQVGTRDKNVGWYTPTMETVDPAVRDLFENYSHIEPDKVIPFILEMVRPSPRLPAPTHLPLFHFSYPHQRRTKSLTPKPQRDRAWDVFPYPCIGQLRFIDLSLSRSPAYPRVLSSLAAGSTLLDLGCCVAQDLRKLVRDGAPASQLYGAELEAPFIDMGYELFRDKESFKAHFMVADIFDMSEERPLKALEGKMDIVHAGLFLHLFDWPEQVSACERIVQVLKAEPGALVLGQQMGTVTPGRVNHGHRILFKHDASTFKKLWAEVGEKTGTQWKVEVQLDEGLGVKEGRRKWDGEQARRLIFEVERLA
jgi:SAM-dependent methyltransferase